MQAKYTVLTSIVKKINETTADRKKYDKEHKRLLEELTEAKRKLRETHVKFKIYVKELIAKKEEIDKIRLVWMALFQDKILCFILIALKH